MAVPRQVLSLLLIPILYLYNAELKPNLNCICMCIFILPLYILEKLFLVFSQQDGNKSSLFILVQYNIVVFFKRADIVESLNKTSNK